MFKLLEPAYCAFQHHQPQLEDVHRFLQLYVLLLNRGLHEVLLCCVELEYAESGHHYLGREFILRL